MTVQPLTNAILVGLESDSSEGKPWIEVDPAHAEVAFNDALRDLPDRGGTLYVLPTDGTIPYTFTGQVKVTKRDVTVEFMSGSELNFPPSDRPQESPFLVISKGFRCLGARVKVTIRDSNNVGTPSFFRVEASDAQFLDCRFEAKQDVSASMK